MKRLLILQGWLPHYRKPFLNRLAQHYRLTVLHSGTASVSSEDVFAEIVLPHINFFRIKWQHNLTKIIRDLEPDMVVAGDDLQYLSFARARIALGSALPWSWWGVDENQNRLFSKIKFRYIFQNADALIFYDRMSLARVRRLDVDPRRLFLANNTVFVANHQFKRDFKHRHSFINVGSMDARKKNDTLVRVFAQALKQRGRKYKLYLIGDGPEVKSLQLLVDTLGVADNVILTGKIEDPQLLLEYYKDALASVSFGQAGLAVLQSMAYGVPFLTSKNAISGGEISNIDNGRTGVLCENNDADLLKTLLNLIDNPSKCEEMGEACLEYYRDRASVDGMVAGFRAALAYGAN